MSGPPNFLQVDAGTYKMIDLLALRWSRNKSQGRGEIPADLRRFFTSPGHGVKRMQNETIRDCTFALAVRAAVLHLYLLPNFNSWYVRSSGKTVPERPGSPLQ
jgi:hypothetical protein